MKADKIIVSHFDFLVIKSLQIDRGIGVHAKAEISGYISEENAQNYRRKLLENLWVTMTVVAENGESKIVMSGIVAGFTLDQQADFTALTLVIMSGTYLLDGVRHYRSFQNTNETYLDVMEQINQGYQSTNVIGDICLEQIKIDFLLQYEETDWEFIKRISSHLQLPVTPLIGRNGVLYHVGDARHQSYELPPVTTFSIKKNIDVFMKQASNGEGSFYEQDYLEYCITDREIYDLWDELILDGHHGYVYQIQSTYQKEELFHTYLLRSMEQIKTVPLYNKKQAGCSFLAVVTAVRQDQVLISLMNDEHAGQEITRWFPYATGYSSPDGPAWYCMPEVGDFVRLQIPDKREEAAYVISAVHKENDSARQNPDHKSFKTKYGKELLFTPTSIMMTNNKGMHIKIEDEKGIEIISDKDILLQSRGNMTLSSEQASLMVAGNSRVNITQAGASVQMEDDITFTGGKFRIQ